MDRRAADGRGGESVSVPMATIRRSTTAMRRRFTKPGGRRSIGPICAGVGTMDRHLTYVAMTRHRDGVQLYAAWDEFTNAGRLVEHGAAPFEHIRRTARSYFVTLETTG